MNSFYDDCWPDYHDSTWSWQLRVWLAAPSLRDLERLSAMDHRKQYISDEEMKQTLRKALTEREKAGLK